MAHHLSWNHLSCLQQGRQQAVPPYQTWWKSSGDHLTAFACVWCHPIYSACRLQIEATRIGTRRYLHRKRQARASGMDSGCGPAYWLICPAGTAGVQPLLSRISTSSAAHSKAVLYPWRQASVVQQSQRLTNCRRTVDGALTDMHASRLPCGGSRGCRPSTRTTPLRPAHAPAPGQHAGRAWPHRRRPQPVHSPEVRASRPQPRRACAHLMAGTFPRPAKAPR